MTKRPFYILGLPVISKFEISVRRMHESMKWTSDFVAAFLRLGVLGVIIVFTFRRGMPHDEMGFMFWNLSEWSMVLFLSLVSLLWIILFFRVFGFMFFVAVSPLMSLVAILSGQEAEKADSSARKLKGNFLSLTIISVALVMLVIIMSLTMMVTAAAIYEITVFLEGERT